MLFPQRGRLKLSLLYLFGLCFCLSQTDEEMLTRVVGESITFSNPAKQGGSLLYNGVIIAVVVKGNMDSYQDSFKDRIQWDQQTGQFTITDLKTSDSGMYVVDGKGNVTSYQLTVYEPVSRPTLTAAVNESCLVECSVKNDRDVTLSWYSGDVILNQTSSPELPFQLTLPLEVDVQNRPSYRCEAANPVTKENVTFHVPEFCKENKVTDTDNKRAYWPLIAVICILLALFGVGIAIFRKKRRNGFSQDPSERQHGDIQYAEISHIIPTHIQPGRTDISELDAPREIELTSVYDKLQFHRMSDISDAETESRRGETEKTKDNNISSEVTYY